MRFSIVAFAAVAVALVSTSAFAAENNALANLADDVDEAGNKIQVIESDGDHDFDDDDDEASPVRRSHKHKHRSNRNKKNKKSTHLHKLAGNSRMINGDTQITWYASHDLKNPQCGDGSWNPTNNAHIGAVMAGWEGGPSCGEFVHLCKGEDKCLRVRIVDKCAGCKKNHVDLTKSAFKQLDPNHSLDTGVVKGLKLYQTSKPAPWDKGLFGPLRLKN